MTTKYRAPGDVLHYVNAGAAIVSGKVMVLGSASKVSIGVALGDIAATTGLGEVGITGVYELAKLDAAVIVAGESVDWDVSTQSIDDNLMTPAAGDVQDCGIAMESKGATVGATILVKLLPGQGTLT